MKRTSPCLAALPVAALVLLAPTAAAADDSEAGATAVNLVDQVVISETSATTEGDGAASAEPLKLGGETVVGGTQEGAGEQSGELAGTGENEQGELTVAPWQTTVSEDESSGSAAVAHGRLGDTSSDQYAEVTVLESHSHATSDGSRASTTGARIDLGGQLMLQLLHAETTSEGDGSSALAIVNGEGIGTSEQFAGQCRIPAEPLVDLLCLYARAHSGDTELPEDAGDAGVADIVALDGNITADLFQVTAAPAVGDDTTPEDQPPGAPNDDGDVPGDPEVQPRTLPRTGGGAALLPWALGLIGAGAGMDRLRRHD